MEALRLNRPLLVVVNEDLMDNHQTELAEELARNHYLAYCTPEYVSRLPHLLTRYGCVCTHSLAAIWTGSRARFRTLLDAVRALEPARLKRFPRPEPGRFAALLDRAMGYPTSGNASTSRGE